MHSALLNVHIINLSDSFLRVRLINYVLHTLPKLANKSLLALCGCQWAVGLGIMIIILLVLVVFYKTV